MSKSNTQARQGILPRSNKGRAIAVLGGGILSLAIVVGGTVGQELGATSRPAAVVRSSAGASTMPSGNPMIGDGLANDGSIRLTVNKSTVVTTTRPYKQVSVGQPEIADVNTIGPNNILITAKKAGSTQLIIWDDQNQSQVADIQVTLDLGALQSQLNSMFPGTKIEVQSLNGAVALKGRVPDLQTAEQASSAAAPFGAKVLNYLEIGGGQQVMLQVRFAEVSRGATSALGVNFAVTDGTSSYGSNVSGLAPNNLTSGNQSTLEQGSISSAVTLFAAGVQGDSAFRLFLSALRQNNLLRILAEPNLTAISGQEASFLAGGEFPVPVPQSGGAGGGSTAITIEYREFGVRLNFVPIVLGDGRVRLKLSPEVSDLDFSTPIVISGSRIPVVNKRRVNTTVELADGQTFAIAGLLDNSVNATNDAVPLLGDLPVLGALFRSVRYERHETELVVLVTPKLVAPLNPDQVPALPGEKWRHPTDPELFLKPDLGNEQTSSAADGKGTSASAEAPKFEGEYGFSAPVATTNEGE
jgi:pilus assembly protein CpaC